MRTVLTAMILFLMGLSVSHAATPLPVSGQVVDYLARPVVGAEVVVYERQRGAGNDYTVKLVGPIVKTAADGRFKLEIESLSQYDTFIVARKSGLAMAWDGLNYSSNTVSQGVFLLVLEKPCTQTGRVVDDLGRPVIGAAIQILPKTSYMDRLSQRPMFGPEDWFACQTDNKGVFRFDNLSADVKSDFRVTPKDSQCTQTFTTHYQNCCGFEIDRPDVELVLAPTHPVSGRVVDDHNLPVVGVTLEIQYKRETENIRHRYRPMQTTTNVQGEFHFPEVPAGENQIQLVASGETIAEWVGEPKFAASGPFDQGDAIVKVEKGGILEVLARNATTDAALEGMTVYVGMTSGTTDDQGRVQMRVLPGEHNISVWGTGYSSTRTNEPVVVKAGETTTQTMLLDQEKSSRLTGQVKDEQGAEAPGVMVTPFPFGDQSLTDEQGRFESSFELRYAKSGVYVIARDLEKSAVAVTHTETYDQPISLTLSPALTVQGKILDPNGRGIPAARVALRVLYSNCVAPLGHETLTDSNGQFEVRAVPTKGKDYEYRISVHASGYAPQTFARVTIEGEPGQIAEIDPVVLQPTILSLSGVVVDANGVPAPQVIMFLRGDKGAKQPDKATATDEQGRFGFSGLAEGPVSIQLNFSSSKAGNGTLKCQAGDHAVKGILGQTVVHESYKILKGKPLPDLAQLIAGDLDAKLMGKPLLLIFWDMEQRPSRRALTQLARKAEILKEKNAVVVAVDISGATAEDLQTWKADTDIPSVVMPIQGAFEERKLDWGVKALPWMIVTDKKHRVEGEGLSIEEVVSALMAQETDGLVLKLSLDKAVYQPDEAVTLSLEAHNEGAQRLNVMHSELGYEVFLDGRGYRYDLQQDQSPSGTARRSVGPGASRRMFTVDATRLESGHPPLTMTLPLTQEHWRTAQTHEALVMRPGEHMISVTTLQTLMPRASRGLVMGRPMPSMPSASSAPVFFEVAGDTETSQSLYFGRALFEDGSPATTDGPFLKLVIGMGADTDNSAAYMADVADDGTFVVGLTLQEVTRINQGALSLEATFVESVRNLSLHSEESTPIAPDSLSQAASEPGTIKVARPPIYYGRILYEDGTVPDRPTGRNWMFGVSVRDSVRMQGNMGLDEAGYFALFIPATEMERLKSRNIPYPIFNGSPKLQANGRRRRKPVGVFPLELLARDKTKAGTVKIQKLGAGD